MYNITCTTKTQEKHKKNIDNSLTLVQHTHRYYYKNAV